MRVVSLLEIIEEQMQQNRQQHTGNLCGKQPNCPMILFYMGQDVTQAKECIAKTMKRSWPSYELEAGGILIDWTSKETLTYTTLCEEEDGHLIREEQLFTTINNMFSEKSLYADKSHLLFYMILDTTQMRTIQEVEQAIEGLRRHRETLKAVGGKVMLFLYLDESYRQESLGKNIRMCWENIGGKLEAVVDCVYILSNRLHNNASLQSKEDMYRACGNLITLSNQGTWKHANIYWQGSKMKTVGYAIYEKPVSKISASILWSYLKWINQARIEFANEALITIQIRTQNEVKQRLESLERGTISIFSEYADDFIEQELGGGEKLEYFPRRQMNGTYRLLSLELTQFNQMTMGAWDYYLSQCATQFVAAYERDDTMRECWFRLLEERIQVAFTPEELMRMELESGVYTKGLKRKHNGESGNLLEASKRELQRKIWDGCQVESLVLKAMQQAKRMAKHTLDAWKEQMESGVLMMREEEENIIGFYEKYVQKFFDECGDQMKQELRRIHSEEGMEVYLVQHLKELLQSDRIFSMSFEEELQSRMGSVQEYDTSRKIKSYLLSEQRLQIFLQTISSLGSPAGRVLLMGADTMLQKEMQSTETSGYHIHHTYSNQAAEIIQIYELDAMSLCIGGA